MSDATETNPQPTETNPQPTESAGKDKKSSPKRYPDVPKGCIQIRFRATDIYTPFPYSNYIVEGHEKITRSYAEKSRNPNSDVLEISDPHGLLKGLK